jgi:hypothetical protein
MKIIGLEGMTGDQLNMELQLGGKFIIFQYCISIIVLTFRQSSDIYFIKANENAVSKGIGFSLISLLCGWWGIPWGPIYTIQSLITNFNGGKDVTQDVIRAFNQPRV